MGLNDAMNHEQSLGPDTLPSSKESCRFFFPSPILSSSVSFESERISEPFFCDESERGQDVLLYINLTRKPTNRCNAKNQENGLIDATKTQDLRAQLLKLGWALRGRKPEPPGVFDFEVKDSVCEFHCVMLNFVSV